MSKHRLFLFLWQVTDLTPPSCNQRLSAPEAMKRRGEFSHSCKQENCLKYGQFQNQSRDWVHAVFSGKTTLHFHCRSLEEHIYIRNLRTLGLSTRAQKGKPVRVMYSITRDFRVQKSRTESIRFQHRLT